MAKMQIKVLVLNHKKEVSYTARVRLFMGC